MQVKNYRQAKAEPVAGETGVTFRWLGVEAEENIDFGLCLYEIKRGANTRVHAHTREQRWFVVAGSGAVHGAEGESTLEAGDVVYVPPGEPHQFLNMSSEILRLLVVVPILPRATLAEGEM